jgi:hypothetical protein
MNAAPDAHGRAIVELADIRGRAVREYALRPDCRQFRLFLDEEHILLVSAWIDSHGEPRLDLDLLTLPGLGEHVRRRHRHPPREHGHRDAAVVGTSAPHD